MNAPISQQYLRKSRPIYDSLHARGQDQRWETFIENILARLELAKEHRARAEKEYQRIGEHVAAHFELSALEVDVFPQGSMRTNTTIRPRGNAKFDLDIVVRLLGTRFEAMTPDKFFETFGKSLDGLPDFCGAAEPKNRCWRLPFCNFPFYFDVTPALPGNMWTPGSPLRVRDRTRGWTFSNPREFAKWFEEIADKRFFFRGRAGQMTFDAAKSLAPLPDSEVAMDDVLRRAIQLMKLHRDNYYHYLSPERKDAAPISVIIMTLATHAYNTLATSSNLTADNSLEIVLELIEMMPRFIRYDQNGAKVLNPTLPQENFADRWRNDHGAREREFREWHAAVMEDLEAMFGDDADKCPQERIRKVFGEAGVDAWKASQQPTSAMFPGIVAATSIVGRPSSYSTRNSRTTLS